MRLIQALVETEIARPGMSVSEALHTCVKYDIPGVPFADATGRIRGRFSVRHTFLVHSIPSDMIKGAHLIGHKALHLEHPDRHYAELFRRTIDDLILPDIASLAPDAQVTKAMALMERFNTGYLFVIDAGRYLGVVTRLGLTRRLLEEYGDKPDGH